MYIGFNSLFMFFRNFLSFISIVLVSSTFGLNLQANAEAFSASNTFEVVNLNDCNLSVKYNNQKFELNTLNIATVPNYFLTSKADSKVFVRLFCSANGTTKKISDLGPFWSGAEPDFTQNVATDISVKAYGSDPATAGYVTFVKNSVSASKVAVIAYSYRGTGFGSVSELNNGSFSTQANIQNTDLGLRFITDPAAPTVTPTPSLLSDFETIDFNDCGTYLKYNKSRFQAPINNNSEILINSKNGKGYIRINCSKTARGGNDISTLPFWVGRNPDPAKYYLTGGVFLQYDVPNPTYINYFGNISKEDSNIPNKSYFSIEYYYNLDGINRKFPFNEQNLAKAFDMNVEDLKVGFKEAIAIIPAPTVSTIQTNATPDPAQPNDRFRFDSTKYPTCIGKTGKYLNIKGEVIKKPKNTSKLIYADSNGTILGTNDNIIYCVKSAKKSGFVNCNNNADQVLDYKGKKVQAYLRGTVFYASKEFGDIYTDKSNGVNCTGSSVLLNALKW